MSDEHLRQAALRLREAIRNEGPHPDWHHQIMGRHRKEWPTLWRAIDRLLELVELVRDPHDESNRYCRWCGYDRALAAKENPQP